MLLDLNCDLGEGEPLEKTAALLRSVTSANIACGGHAGDDQSIPAAIRMAMELQVNIGAHPGLPGQFGRGVDIVSPDAFHILLHDQFNRFSSHLRTLGAHLHHIKLHGTLYHLVERDEPLRQAYLDFIRQLPTRPVIYALAGGAVAHAARQAALEVWEEAFLDRNYRADLSLVPRSEPAAIITNPQLIQDRLRSIQQGRGLQALDGTTLRLSPRTLCIHSDSPNSIAIAALARQTLKTSAG